MFGISVSGFSQLKMHSFEEAEKLSVQNPKPYFIFITTDWCKICKMMEKSTFKNPEIVKILNEKFYFVELDAGNKTDIIFGDKTFQFQPNGINSGIHELAYELGNIGGELAFPTITILNPELSIIGQKSGFIESESLLRIFN